MKFGASLLTDGGNWERIGRVVAAARREQEVGVVLSAREGALGSLAAMASQAEKGQGSYLEAINRVRGKHLETVRRLFPPKEQAGVITPIQILLNDLEDILHGVQLIMECSPRTLDMVLSFGPRLSCILFTRYLRLLGLEAQMPEARALIQTDQSFGGAQVDFPPTYARIREELSRLKGIPVLPGGAAATAAGVATTLGRNGSDYTACLVGAAVEAERIEIWTGSDGVASADPTHVPEAFVVQQLSYAEAMELSYFGARMLHPLTMIPAAEKGVPIQIRNLFKPELPGTLISSRIPQRAHFISGIASIDRVALVNIEGAGMVGIPGIAARIFKALAAAAVNVMMISQASSEHSICLVFRQEEADRALRALEQELVRELESRRVQSFDLRDDLAIVAIIGEKMRGTPGIAGRLFSCLGQAEVNVLAIAQGSSERNISLVVERRDMGKALQTIHRAFLGKADS